MFVGSRILHSVLSEVLQYELYQMQGVRPLANAWKKRVFNLNAGQGASQCHRSLCRAALSGTPALEYILGAIEMLLVLCLVHFLQVFQELLALG